MTISVADGVSLPEGGGGGGTVTDVSVVTANGVSGSVATSTTTPAITLTLGDITPGNVSATGFLSSANYLYSGTNGSIPGRLYLYGSTSGQAILTPPAVAGTPTITLPGVTSTLATLGANSFTDTQTITKSIAATSTDGAVLQNTTAAAAGAQQWSPRLRLTGQGWKTTATAASQEVSWIAEVQPIQGSSAPTSQFQILSSINGGAYGERLSFDSGGTKYNFSSAFSLWNGGSGALGIGSPSDQYLVVWGNTVASLNRYIGFSSSAGSVAAQTIVTNMDVILSRSAAATLQQGAANVDTGPVNQTLQSQGVLASGTSNVSGSNFTIQSGIGKGNAAGSSLIFKTPVPVASGTGAQTMTTALTLTGANAIFAGTITGASIAYTQLTGLGTNVATALGIATNTTNGFASLTATFAAGEIPWSSGASATFSSSSTFNWNSGTSTFSAPNISASGTIAAAGGITSTSGGTTSIYSNVTLDAQNSIRNLNSSTGTAASATLEVRNSDNNSAVILMRGTGYTTSGLIVAGQGEFLVNGTTMLFRQQTANDIIYAIGGSAATNEVARLLSASPGTLSLGVAGTNVGAVTLNNATSGSVTISPIAGALGTVTITAPALTGTMLVGSAVNSVSPTSPNRTITIVHGGTTYYIAAKTTND